MTNRGSPTFEPLEEWEAPLAHCVICAAVATKKIVLREPGVRWNSMVCGNERCASALLALMRPQARREDL